MAALIDAHCHLQDAQLASYLEETLSSDISTWLVNGTSPSDWAAVASLCERDDRIIPAFGWHPWHVSREAPAMQFDTLLKYLELYPRAHVGEIGVDRWKAGLDEGAQVETLVVQLEIAAAAGRPATVHCLKAWGLLEEAWKRAQSKPQRILLHAFNGSAETAQVWLKRGAFFSFSTYFIHARKSAIREIFRTLPTERILVETDAPAMSPPLSECIRPIETVEGNEINHPLNLTAAYRALARLRSVDFDALVTQVADNFNAFAEVSS
ncbi:MAG: TatD family hydrolase [Opitutales bacterium]